MMTIRQIALCAVLVAAVPGALPSQDLPGGLIPTADQPPTRQGTRGANFLEIGIGGRGNALAGALVSFVDGPTAWYWNPAGAAAVEAFSVSATRQNLYDDLDIAQSYFAAAMPAFGGVFGVSFNSLSSGDIERTTVESPFGDPVLGDTYEWSSSAIGIGYARRMTDRLDVGLGLKYVTEGLTDAEISWAALDLGTQFRTGLYGLVLGANIANVGPASKMEGTLLRRQVQQGDDFPQDTRIGFGTRETELPTLFRFSIGSDLFGRTGSILGQGGGHSLIAEISAFDAIDTDIQGAIGAEYGFRDLLFLRGGKRFYNDDRATGDRGIYGLSGGFGLRAPLGGRFLRFDYAYTSLGDLQNMQVFTFEFGR